MRKKLRGDHRRDGTLKTGEMSMDKYLKSTVNCVEAKTGKNREQGFVEWSKERQQTFT